MLNLYSITLQTNDGNFLAKVEILQVVTQLPDVVFWGDRIFKQISTNPDIYREAFVMTVYTPHLPSD